MAFEPKSLQGLSRTDLLEHARAAKIEHAELLTRAELVVEIERARAPGPRARPARGWLGVARDLLASALEHGLDLPEAAKIVRGEFTWSEPVSPGPVATVTLAEIYAAQGHPQRALAIIEEVLAREPDHEAARRLRARIAGPPAPPAASVPDEATPRVAPAEPAPKPVHEDSPSTQPPAPPSSVPVSAAPPSSAPSSARPSVDAVVLVRLDPLRTHVYWELRPDTLARMRERDAGGSPAVVLVSLQPSWDGARRVERVVRVDALQGSAIVEGFGPAAVVRAALTWRSGGKSRVLAVATELAACAAKAGGEIRIQWTPLGTPLGAPEPHHLRAAAHARRAAR